MNKVLGKMQISSGGPGAVLVDVDVESTTKGWQWKSGSKGGHVDTLNELATAVLDAHRLVPTIGKGIDGLLEGALIIISNVSNGDWSRQPLGWQNQAKEWVESYRWHISNEAAKAKRYMPESVPGTPILFPALKAAKLEHLIDSSGKFRTQEGKQLWAHIQAGRIGIVPVEATSPMYCNHANESPHGCHCGEWCYCRVSGNCGTRDNQL